MTPKEIAKLASEFADDQVKPLQDAIGRVGAVVEGMNVVTYLALIGAMLQAFCSASGYTKSQALLILAEVADEPITAGATH